MRILIVGDVVGEPGRRAVQTLLPALRSRHRIDFAIVNCENAAAGMGATPDICEELLEAGADCLTGGNHIWRRREIYPYIEEECRLLRPANYPPGAPGSAWQCYGTPKGQVSVANLMGRTLMEPLDCPFRAFDAIAAEARNLSPVLVVDFHAEATSEKQAMGWHAAGRASAVIGTHTHVQTADERILPGGTAYLTDVGMTGPIDGILGIRRDLILERFLTQLPVRFEIAPGPVMLMAVLIEVEESTGQTRSITRLQEVVRD